MGTAGPGHGSRIADAPTAPVGRRATDPATDHPPIRPVGRRATDPAKDNPGATPRDQRGVPASSASASPSWIEASIAGAYDSRTTSTEHGAWSSTFRATLPRIRRRSPV